MNVLKALPLLLAATTMGCANTDSQTSEADRPPAATGATAPLAGMSDGRTLAQHQEVARANRAALDLPLFETTPAQLEQTATRIMAEADRRLDLLAAQAPEAATFQSTIAALDHIVYPVKNTANRFDLIKETSVDPELRKAASEQVTRLGQWFVGLQYREGVYRAAKSFEDAYTQGRRPRLAGEDKKLFEDTMRDYRRAGMHLDRATRDKVEALQKQLTSLSTEFGDNITNAQAPVEFPAAELEGVPASFLAPLERSGDKYVIKANVTPQFLGVMQNAKSEETRKRLKMVRFSIAQPENGPVLDEIVRIRSEIASLLGYASWNDYKIEPKMAKTGERAIAFVTDLADGLEPKFRAELEAMRSLKVADTGDANAVINSWDWRYYENQIKKDKYNVDAEALRVYFPYQACLDGMFEIYAEIFGLAFNQVRAPYAWHPEVTLYVISDAASGEPLGMFYLDMFPREGKFNHFAQFGIIDGKLLEDGRYQRPVVSLVCNFTPPAADRPSLLAHHELETLFHEFGHALHSILTSAKYVAFSGTSVPRDFVEAPSQMLEAWVWDTSVLNRFAADYRDRSKQIEPAILAKMEEARLATIGTFYRRQLAFGTADLRLHAPGEYKNAQEILNQAMADVFLAPPPGTHYGAYFGHLTGYDAGYYGYAWADAIAADMATVFEKSNDGLMSREIGMRLRNEIYAVGGSRDIEESIRAFLGRDRSLQPFLASIGLGEPSRTTGR